MAVRHVTRRRLFRVAALIAAGAGLFGPNSASASAIDVDVYVVAGTATITGGPLLPTPTNTSYSIDNGTTCVSAGPVAGYVDLSRSESGPCTAMSGGGSLSKYSGCTTGEVSADWQLTEPSNEVASFMGTGVVVGGIIVVGASPSMGSDGYRDPTTASAGEGSAVGLLVPELGQVCNLAGVDKLQIDATIVGEYSGSFQLP
jgi:hypothetical protein